MLLLKEIIKGLTPPYIWLAAKSGATALGIRKEVKPDEDPDTLFDGDDEIFKEAITTARVYGEYGVGKSTLWVARNYEVSMIGVDSSKTWLKHVRENIPESRWLAKHVDIGPLGNWGSPLAHKHRANYENYASALWETEHKPDVVLVDGRFRVACFLTCLLEAQPGTKVVFDDYVCRPRYHLVEEFCKPVKKNNRQALFIVPEVLDRDEVGKTRDEFLMVTE